MEQVLRLINIAGTPRRMQVIPPDSSEFKVVYPASKGSIAPGLAEQLVVQFTGRQLRYHYDCIRVHTQGGGLLIPLHAYPLMNEVALPRQLHFGKVALGESASRRLQLSCKVPLDYEFSVTVTKHNKCFNVFPLSGKVPAEGSVWLTISFTPTSQTTQELKFEVLVSEHNAQSMTVTVTGTGSAGLVRERLLEAAVQAVGLEQQQQGRKHNSSRICGLSSGPSGKARQQLPSVHSGSKLPGSGHIAEQTQHVQDQPEVLLGGTYFPAALTGQHAVNSVLNQAPGKLRSKDLKAAIAVRKQELQLEQQQLEELLQRGNAAGVDPLDDPSVTLAVKEAMFQMLLGKAEAGSRSCTGLVAAGSSNIGIGPPSQEEVQRLQAARQRALLQHCQAEQEAGSHRLQASMQVAGANHMLQQVDAASSGRSMERLSHAGPPAYPGLEDFKPQWLLLEGNEWRKRVQVAQRFINAVRVVIYRNRPQARLRKLKAMSARLCGNKRLLAGAAVQELVLESTAVVRPGVEPTRLMLPENVRMAELPLYRPASFSHHQPVPNSPYADFSMLHPLPYKAEFEYKLLGYTLEEYPALMAHLAPATDQPLLSGAREELPGGSACGLLPSILADAQQMDSLPQGLCSTPHGSLTLNRITERQVFAVLPTAWGLEAGSLLQPQQYPIQDSTVLETPGSNTIRALADHKSRSQWCLPSQDPWQVHCS
eukprot:gene2309-2617_t